MHHIKPTSFHRGRRLTALTRVPPVLLRQGCRHGRDQKVRARCLLPETVHGQEGQSQPARDLSTDLALRRSVKLLREILRVGGLPRPSEPSRRRGSPGAWGWRRPEPLWQFPMIETDNGRMEPPESAANPTGRRDRSQRLRTCRLLGNAGRTQTPLNGKRLSPARAVGRSSRSRGLIALRTTPLAFSAIDYGDNLCSVNYRLSKTGSSRRSYWNELALDENGDSRPDCNDAGRCVPCGRIDCDLLPAHLAVCGREPRPLLHQIPSATADRRRQVLHLRLHGDGLCRSGMRPKRANLRGWLKRMRRHYSCRCSLRHFADRPQ